MRAVRLAKFGYIVAFGIFFSGCTMVASAPPISSLPTPLATENPDAGLKTLATDASPDPALDRVSEGSNAGSASSDLVQAGRQYETLPIATLEGKVVATPTMRPIPPTKVTLVTDKGKILMELFPKEAPATVENFLAKINSGEYKGRIFHRVENWVIQGGDPLGNGTGGGSLPTELSRREFVPGSVGVARGGNIQISNADQFFICTDDCSWLTGKYTNLGKVISGMDVAKKIQVGDKILDIVPVGVKR